MIKFASLNLNSFELSYNSHKICSIIIQANRGRQNVRSKCTRISHPPGVTQGYTRVIQIRVNPPEEEAEEMNSYHSESESGDEGNYDLIQALFEE